jgi:hypothetical protein
VERVGRALDFEEDISASHEAFGSNTILNGVGQEIVFEPVTIARECPVQWTRGVIDLGELARLRREGWTSKQLQAYFGFGRTKINLELRKIRKNSSPNHASG